MTIKFRDLSGWLKTSTILAWVVGGIYTLVFLIGFFEALFIY